MFDDLARSGCWRYTGEGALLWRALSKIGWVKVGLYRAVHDECGCEETKIGIGWAGLGRSRDGS